MPPPGQAGVGGRLQLTFGSLAAHTQEMRRALAMLKYIPAVLCGLLVGAWVASWCVTDFGRYQHVNIAGTYGNAGLMVQRSCIITWFDENSGRPSQFLFYAERPKLSLDLCLGDFERPMEDIYSHCFPIPLILSVFLPLAGTCLGTRFPLWSYFAWTALIAAELAYYLR